MFSCVYNQYNFIEISHADNNGGLIPIYLLLPLYCSGYYYLRSGVGFLLAKSNNSANLGRQIFSSNKRRSG